MRAFKVILVLGLLALAGLVGFAYFGDLTPQRGEVSQPVPLSDAGGDGG